MKKTKSKLTDWKYAVNICVYIFKASECELNLKSGDNLYNRQVWFATPKEQDQSNSTSEATNHSKQLTFNMIQTKLQNCLCSMWFGRLKTHNHSSTYKAQERKWDKSVKASIK